jgi:PAS domain S-box-containing protein
LESLQVGQTHQIIENNGKLAWTATVEVAVAVLLTLGFVVIGGLWLNRLAGQRIRAQKALEDSERRFQLVSRATSDRIWDWDIVTGAVWWDENLKSVYGYAPGEIDPGVEGWQSLIHPEDRERVMRSISAVIDSGELTWSDEYRFRCRDGSYLDVLNRGYLTRDSDGRPVRAVGAPAGQVGR